jgi:uncharacterized protein YecT (DUF1311 family)
VTTLACAALAGSPVLAAECDASSAGVGLDSAQASLRCIERIEGVNDKKLNAAYRRLLSTLKDDPDQGTFVRSHLVAAQRACIAFRDSECELKADLAGGAPQWRAVNQAQCVSDLTAERANALASYGGDAREN